MNMELNFSTEKYNDFRAQYYTRVAYKRAYKIWEHSVHLDESNQVVLDTEEMIAAEYPECRFTISVNNETVFDTISDGEEYLCSASYYEEYYINNADTPTEEDGSSEVTETVIPARVLEFSNIRRTADIFL